MAVDPSLLRQGHRWTVLERDAEPFHQELVRFLCQPRMAGYVRFQLLSVRCPVRPQPVRLFVLRSYN